MHEMSVAQGIVEVIEAEREKRGFESVKVVRLRLGTLSGIDEEARRFAFEVARENTWAAQAELEMGVEERILTCRSCGAKLTADRPVLHCPECGSTDLSLQGGMELDIVSLEVE